MVSGNVHILGFSLTGFGDPESYGALLQTVLRQAGYTGFVREVSYGGLSVNALAGLMESATAAVEAGDWIALELATSFMSLQGYTVDQALPYVFAITKHLLDRGHSKIVFLNLYRADLDDRDCVVQAIEAVSEFFGLPVCDLKSPFRRVSNLKAITTDGIHPSLGARRQIAEALARFLLAAVDPSPRHRDAVGPAYRYVDLSEVDPRFDVHSYSARGKCLKAAVVPAGFTMTHRFTREECVEGYCFLYGPETGYVNLQVQGSDAITLATFDEHSYYRRIGYRPVGQRGTSVSVTARHETRDVALVRETTLPRESRRELVCGVVLKAEGRTLPSGLRPATSSRSNSQSKEHSAMADPKNMQAASFDSVAYWRARHEQYLSDLQGVGNVSLDANDNQRIYKAIDAYVETLVRAIAVRSGGRVLDLGCGIGMLADAFLRSGLDYTGVDVSDAALTIARERHPRGRFEVADIAQLPMQGTFDLIVERTVFIHLVEQSRWQSVLAEVKRLLADSGVFILIDNIPTQNNDAPQDATHVRFRRRADYETEFARLGLAFDPELRDRVAAAISLSPHTHFVTHSR